MKILGIDPGSAVIGWGVITIDDGITYSNNMNGEMAKHVKLDTYGCIILEKIEKTEIRLKILKEEIDKVMQFHKPDSVVVERLFFGVNVKTAINVAQARGVLMLATAENEIVYEEYTGLQVKKGIAGDGRADKKQMQEAVRAFLDLENLPEVTDQLGKSIFRFRDDAADAVACALFHFKKQHGLLPT